MIIAVVYGKIVDMDQARRCPRCDGTGHERYAPRETCRRCRGRTVAPEGWAYLVPSAEAESLAVGDVVECPPTPYSHDRPVLATVVDTAAEPLPGKPLKTIIRRVGAAWPEEVSS